MLHHRHFIGRSSLRALIFASIAGVSIGAGVMAGTALAEPVAHAAPATQAAFVSDRLSVQVVGQGPDVILIPGLASSREVWTTEAARLKATHRVHLVQLAGFAGEPWSHGDGAFVQPVVDELARYVREQNLQRPAVIGHSMGALVGLRLAQDHPALVGKLMSVDSLPFFSALYGPTATVETATPIAAQMSQALLAMDEAAFTASQTQTGAGMARDLATREAIVRWSLATDRHALAAAMRDVMTTDARPGLEAMTTPVTVLYASDADGGAPAAMADAMWTREYASLPGARLIRVDDSRHFIMVDQPERFGELMDEFLK